MKALINIWMSPIYARLNMESRRSLYILLALFPVVGQIIAAITYYAKGADAKVSIFFFAFLISLAGLIAILAITWFAMLILNVSAQFSPANAALVPTLGRQLRLALAVPIAVVSIMVVALIYFGEHQLKVLPAFLCVLFFSYFIGAMRAQWLIFPMIFSFQVPVILKHTQIFEGTIIDSFWHGRGANFVLLLASVLMLWGVLHWFFSARDEVLFKMYKRTLLLRQGMGAREVPATKIAIQLYSPFLRWMKYHVRRAQASSRQDTILKLSGFSLGARVHWTSVIMQLLFIIATCFAMIIVMKLLLGAEDKKFISVFSLGFPAVVLIFTPLTFCALNFQTLYQTRTEQALFSLTPVVRDSFELDRAFTRYLFRQFFMLMAFSSLAAIALLENKQNFPLVAEIASLSVSCLFIFALSLTHPFRRMKAASDHPLLRVGLVAVTLLVLGIVMTIFVSKQIAWWFSAAIVSATIVLLVTRLKRNARAVQFPVGRAAE